MDIFEKASKLKLRFASSKGQISTEDLWDLSLTNLDSLAKTVNKSLKEEAEESFIGERKSSSTTLQELRLDILKHVISVKLEEKENARIRAEKNAKIAQLKELLNSKKNEELASKSSDEIEKMLSELEG